MLPLLLPPVPALGVAGACVYVRDLSGTLQLQHASARLRLTRTCAPVQNWRLATLQGVTAFNTSSTWSYELADCADGSGSKALASRVPNSVTFRLTKATTRTELLKMLATSRCPGSAVWQCKPVVASPACSGAGGRCCIMLAHAAL